MMDRELKSRLADAFHAPEPEKKESFIKNLRPREIGIPEMVLTQIPYIRLPIWLFSLLIVAVAIGGSILGMEDTEFQITILMPFTAAITVLETHRSKRSGMSELEMATRFSLRSVIFARLLILGIVSGIVLAIASPVIAASFGRSTVHTAIRILIPYLITMIISLIIERSPLGRTHGYASFAVAGLSLSVTAWAYNCAPLITAGYEEFVSVWGLPTVIILLALTITEQWRTVKTVEAFA